MEEVLLPDGKRPKPGERAFVHKLATTTVSGSSAEANLDMLDERTRFLDGYERKKTASLIWMGSIFGIIGFTFAFIIGLFEFIDPVAFQGMKFNSTYGYFPATIAEMVHNPHEPTGKVFFGFCFTSGIFLFASWYPWELRNVYTGDDDEICGVSWLMLRQYVSPVGYMISVAITSKPWAKASAQDMFTIVINFFGKLLFIVGFVLCEWRTLYVTQFGKAHQTKAVIKRKELVARTSMVSYVSFLTIGFFTLNAFVTLIPGLFPHLPEKHPWFGTYDKWGPGGPNGEIELLDTGTGFYFICKIFTYICDSGTGLAIMYSHLLIWWYCEERKVDLKNKLSDVESLSRSGKVKKKHDAQ